MAGETTLLVAACAWVGLHVGIAGTAARTALARRLGEGGFRGLFSVLSVAAIWFLVASYRRAPAVALWRAAPWLDWVLVPLTGVAFVLLAASVAAPNPTAVGAGPLPGTAPRGIFAVTRHPMLWSFAIWSGVHVAGSGDLASVLFFGAFGVTALAGMPSIDAKIARRDPPGWARLAAATSIVPFAAIAGGRNRLDLRGIGWIAPLVGIGLWLGLLWLHHWVSGVAPVPGGAW